jgi:hypothetical protein
VPELVARIGERDGVRIVRHPLAGQNLHAFRAREALRVEAEMQGEFPIQLDEPRRGHGRGSHPGVKPVR